MRRVVSMLLLSVVLFVAANVGAADRVEMSNGSLRIAQPAGEWQADVAVTPGAQKYPAEWQQEFKNPGTIVPVKTSVELGAMRDLVHQQKDTIIELGVVMTGDARGRVIDVVEGEGRVAKPETIYNPYIFFWAAAMLLMTLACWSMRYGKNAAVAFTAAAFVAAFAVAFTAVAFTAIVAAFVIEGKNVKAFRVAVAIFYMEMVVSIIAFYA